MTGVALQLVRSPTDIVNPATGEQLALLAESTATLADLRLVLSRLRAEIDDANRLIDAEVARRLDMENKRSLVLDGVGLKVNAPQRITWNVGLLRTTLDALVEDGRLASGAANRAVEATIVYKPKEAELNKLLRHEDSAIREAIARCRIMEPQRRRVEVSPL